jgi:hypothetical protein
LDTPYSAGTDADLFLVAVGRNALGHDILAELRLLLVGEAAHDRARHAADGRANRTANDGAADSAGGCTGGGTAGLSEGANRGEGHENSACKQDLLGHLSAPKTGEVWSLTAKRNGGSELEKVFQIRNSGNFRVTRTCCKAGSVKPVLEQSR